MEPSLGTRKAVFEGLVEVSGPIGKKIRSGRPIAVAVGTLAGALLGGGVGYLIAPMFAVAFAIVSALVAAVVSAVCFPKPPDTSRPAGWFGAVLHVWDYVLADMQLQVTLTERAIFFGKGADAWQQALAKMAEGVEPDSDLAYWIALDTVRYFERREASQYVTIGYERGGALARRELALGSAPDCEAFIALVQRQIGRPFVASETRMPVGRATLVPLVLFAVALAIVGGLAALAQYWRVSPPTPPVGNNGKPDELVAALTWAGPLGVAAVGSIAVLAALGWAVLRYVAPPKIRVLQIADSDPK